MSGVLCRFVDSERGIVVAILVVLLACALVRCEPALVMARGTEAGDAARDMPTPTFEQVHEQYFRIVWNEAGPKNLADQDGILQSLLFAGGGREPGRNQRGQGYGLDYEKLMRRMVAHSMRTFPHDSEFLLLTDWQRGRLARRQTRRNRWTSTLTLDCEQPAGWPAIREDGGPMPPFKVHFGERCALLVETTRSFLRGEIESRCDGQPTTWGAGPDIYRPGGPIDEGWDEIRCDHASAEHCDGLERAERLNSRVCAQNRFWSWL